MSESANKARAIEKEFNAWEGGLTEQTRANCAFPIRFFRKALLLLCNSILENKLLVGELRSQKIITEKVSEELKKLADLLRVNQE